MSLYYANQYFTTTLNVGGGIDDTQTTGIVLQSITGVDYTKPGIACISYSDPIVTSTAEWVTYTSINNSTKELQGVTRGAEGFSAKSHSNGATIAFPLSESHINNINDILTEITADLAVGKTTTQTLTNKRITQRVVTTTDDATAVIDCDVTDQYELSAVAHDTEFTVTGTPTDGQKLIIRYKDAGVSKNLTFTGFTALGATIPTATTAGKWGYVGAIYNLTATTWHVLAVATEA